MGGVSDHPYHCLTADLAEGVRCARTDRQTPKRAPPHAVTLLRSRLVVPSASCLEASLTGSAPPPIPSASSRHPQAFPMVSERPGAAGLLERLEIPVLLPTRFAWAPFPYRMMASRHLARPAPLGTQVPPTSSPAAVPSSWLLPRSPVICYSWQEAIRLRSQISSRFERSCNGWNTSRQSDDMTS